MNIKKYILLSVLALWSMCMLSSFGLIDDKKKKKKVAKKTVQKAVVKNEDTSHVVIDHSMFMDNVDSLLMFPSHDLYGTWDTSIFHPNLFDTQFTSDSTTVFLLDDWSCGYTAPTRGPVTSDFGWRRRRPHYGTDLNLETGDTVVAAFNGRVRIAKLNKSYGNVVVIRHANGLETVYAHLSKILVSAGEEVTSGTVVGLGGNTGHSYGSHLHFEVRFLGKAIDAEDMIDFEKGEVKSGSFVIVKEDFKAKYDLRNIHAGNVSRSHAGSNNKSGNYRYTTVRQGDNLGKIAHRNHTTISAICKKNGIKQTKIIRPGMKLKV